MASENETHAEIVREMRSITFGEECCPDCGADFQRSNQWPKFADRIEAAHKRKIEFYKQLLMTSQCALEDEIVKNQEHRREIAELRECLTEAIDEKCRSCKNWYGSCPTICDLEKKDCKIIAKWRKALKGANNEN